MKKLRWTWDNFEEVLLCIIITVITLVSGLQVVCRYLFNNSLTWSEEVSRYLFVWTGFLTLSLSIKCRSIISIDAFVLWMPRRVRAGLNMVVYLFCSVVFAMLSVNAWHMVTSSAGQTSPALGLPLAIVYAGPLLGLTLSIFRSLGRIVAETKIVIGKEALALFFGVLVLLLVLTVPICVSFAFVTLLPSIVDASFPYTADAAVRSMVSGLNNFPLLAIPLFIIAGVIMAKGQISERLFNVFSYFVGNRTAGLPCAVTITCLFYGAISGSGPATTAAVGSMCIPLLTSVGYDLTFATALVAVSGSLGIIIPPSIPYIMYCNASGASISELFLAGFLPGVLIALCLMVYSYIYCKIHGEDKDKLNAKCMELRAKGLGTVLKEGFWALMSPVIILGGIYGGICSPTEAATISIFYSLIVSLFIYRTIKIRDLPKIMLEGIHSYAPILIILSAAVAFARVITLMNVATIVSEAVLSAISSKVVILLLINVLLLFVGMIMDTGPAILVFTPVLLPVAEAIGVDPIHFGIIMCVNLAIGFVTPPMGANLFVASNLSKVSVFDIARKAVPFILAFLIALLLITFVPQISMFLLQ
jgi:C4-dicarboxylate transporter DctM subunit